jgi:osmotically inducible lipoprotein OsmB
MRKLLLVPPPFAAACRLHVRPRQDRAVAGAVVGALLADATDSNMVRRCALGALAGAATCGVDLGPAALPPALLI